MPARKIERIVTPEIEALARLHDCGFVLLGHRRFALIDHEDVERVNQHLWTAGDGRYASTHIEKQKTYLQRFIMNASGDLEIDHKNRVRLDCRKENLRPANYLQQMGNKGKVDGKNFTSRFKGVSLDNKTGRWRARIKEDYRGKQIGSFATQEEAARAYNAWAIKRFGEFAVLNEGV